MVFHARGYLYFQDIVSVPLNVQLPSDESLTTGFIDVVVFVRQDSVGYQKVTAVVADHPVVASDGNTNDPAVVAQPLSTKFSVIIVTFQASNDRTCFDHHMSWKIF